MQSRGHCSPAASVGARMCPSPMLPCHASTGMCAVAKRMRCARPPWWNGALHSPVLSILVRTVANNSKVGFAIMIACTCLRCQVACLGRYPICSSGRHGVVTSDLHHPRGKVADYGLTVCRQGQLFVWSQRMLCTNGMPLAPCRYCYYCLRSQCEADPQFCCSQCGVRVAAMRFWRPPPIPP